MLADQYRPPSGFADQTHGNIFSTQNGHNGNGPWMYTSGAGRRSTQGGQEQGVFENGQEMGGTRFGPGGKNGGSDVENNGGPRSDSAGTGNGGEMAGTRYGPGGKNGGSDVENNGGPLSNAAGTGNGGEMAGTRYKHRW